MHKKLEGPQQFIDFRKSAHPLLRDTTVSQKISYESKFINNEWNLAYENFSGLRTGFQETFWLNTGTL